MEVTSKTTSSSKPQKATVAMTFPAQYNVSYMAVNRAKHKILIQISRDKRTSPAFNVTAYLHPTQLGRPVRVLTDLKRPHSIVHSCHDEMIISERVGHRLSVLEVGRGERIRTIGSCGYNSDQMIAPAGLAIDDANNIYVSSWHKLQKFTISGDLIKCIGQKGKKEGEFDDPRGVALHNNYVYVCDCDNHRIQVFDLDLNFVRSIGSHGKGRGELNEPFDVQFDTAGDMYVAELGNGRVQVMNTNGLYIQAFGQEGEGKLRGPSGLHIADKYVYVSDGSRHRVVVYETSGQFVASFGGHGQNNGEFDGPFCINSCPDGLIYICV